MTDFNEANNTGYMFVDKVQSLDNKPNTSSNYGFLETIAINDVTTKQTFVDFQSGFFIRICNNGTWTNYNPQIQISAESGTKRSIFRQKNKTKRSKKRLHTTLIKPEQKVNEDLCSGFIVL